MKIWNEIVSENVVATHFETDDHRYQCVISPIGNVVQGEILEELEYLEKKAGWKRQVREMRQWREAVEQNMEEREHAIERLEDAGYDRDEIPL